MDDSCGLLFVVLSYRWLEKGCPDPNCFHLAIVAEMLRKYIRPVYNYSSPLTWSGCLRGMWSFDGHNWDREAVDCVVFWDFACLVQPPRLGEEKELFTAGLKASNIFYGHQQTVVWMQTALPEGFAERMRGIGLAAWYWSRRELCGFGLGELKRSRTYDCTTAPACDPTALSQLSEPPHGAVLHRSSEQRDNETVWPPS